jgi:hypothetical protein
MRTEVKLITPDLATIYLQKSIGNRNENAKTVAYYADQMSRNLWVLTGQGISFDSNNRLIDGHHRLSAIIKSKKSIPMLLIFGVQDGAFEVYDSGKNRTFGDIYKIEGILNDVQISSLIGKYLRLHTNLNLRDNSNAHELKFTKHDSLQKYYEHSELWQEINKHSACNYIKMRLYPMSTIGSIKAFLIIDKKHPKEKVYGFFDELFTNKPDTLTCTKVLRDYLIKDALSVKSTPPGVKITLLAKTWSYYISGKNSSSLKLIEGDNQQIYLK